MNVKTKYNIGQCVYLVARTDTQILKTCPVCKGTKNVKIKEFGKSPCPNDCRENGKVVDYITHEWEVGHSLIINSINIQLLEFKEGIRYVAYYSEHGSGFPEHKLFSTKYDAKDWCEEANKDPMGNEVYHGKDIFLKN